MTRTDVHQHLWPEALLAALSRRDTPPLIRRSGVRLIVRLPGEPDCALDLRDHDPSLRRAQLERDEVQRALVCLSSPLGIEALPREEAEPLLHAYNSGVLELGGPFDAWGAVALQSPDPDDVDAVLDAGAIGVCLPAGALSSPSGLRRCAAILSRLERRGAPLFVHPGPGPSSAPLERTGADPETPAWWPAMTRYVADMNAAWHAFAAVGRARHPQLRVVFAMLAGGAPLHLERLASRGGPTEAIADTRVFYDTSSYGVRTIDALVRCVGIDQLVYGSDRPVVDAQPLAPLGEAAAAAMAGANVARLLEARALGVPVAA
ncbi:MAG: amidohydrolase family protein [Solirubrobacteraceae bacterium]|nr:amidohydrolase family protein [Solirubrobacteraceae bacterium]